MKLLHLTARREPAKGRRFAWGRVQPASGDAATWRLFRRCLPGGWLTEQQSFSAGDSRAVIAAELRVMRARLLAAADAVDLAHLGLTEATTNCIHCGRDL